MGGDPPLEAVVVVVAVAEGGGERVALAVEEPPRVVAVVAVMGGMNAARGSLYKSPEPDRRLSLLDTDELSICSGGECWYWRVYWVGKRVYFLCAIRIGFLDRAIVFAKVHWPSHSKYEVIGNKGEVEGCGRKRLSYHYHRRDDRTLSWQLPCVTLK